jgi:hypothetical protein
LRQNSKRFLAATDTILAGIVHFLAGGIQVIQSVTTYSLSYTKRLPSELSTPAEREPKALAKAGVDNSIE